MRGWTFTDWGSKVSVDVHLDEAQPDDFDALLLPGGVMNPDALRMQPKAVAFIKSFFDAGKPVAVICHGPWTVIEAGAARGRRIASWPSLKTDLRNAGAEWVDQEVVVDGNLVSSRKPDDIPAFNRAMIDLFKRAAPPLCTRDRPVMSETQLIRCPSCGATNRVPQEKVERGLHRCAGGAKRRCPSTSKPVTVTDATFSAEVERSPLPVLLDMWAPWCGPCRMIAPVIDELASEMAGRVRFAKLNVDENPATAARFNVSSIPTLLVLKEGREVDRIVGVQPKAEIARRLERVTG